MADTLIFLKLDDVEGESTAAGFEEQIEVESASWELSTQSSQTQDSGNDKAGAQVDYGLVTLTKHFDRSSLALLQRSAVTQASGKLTRRQPFRSAVLTMADVVIRSNGEAAKITPVIKIELRDGYIDAYEMRALESTNSVRVEETVKLSFKTIDFTYFHSTDKGASRGVGASFHGPDQTQGKGNG